MICPKCGGSSPDGSRFCTACGSALSTQAKCYCRNCGREVAEKALFCVGCGAAPRSGKNFCQSCSAATNPNAQICLKCGVRLSAAAAEGKDWLLTLLLCIFLGFLGIHRFYTGHIVLGVLQLITAGGCGIWTLIDLILIASGAFKDKDGNDLVRR